MERTEVGGSESERRIREYAGSPGQIIERLTDHDGLVVHGGAVTDAVLDAAPGCASSAARAAGRSTSTSRPRPSAASPW